MRIYRTTKCLINFRFWLNLLFHFDIFSNQQFNKEKSVCESGENIKLGWYEMESYIWIFKFRVGVGCLKFWDLRSEVEFGNFSFSHILDIISWKYIQVIPLVEVATLVTVASILITGCQHVIVHFRCTYIQLMITKVATDKGF